MWKHAHVIEAYAVYLDPTKGNAKNPETDLDPPDAVFFTRENAVYWLDSLSGHPLAVILTVHNCWLPVWAVLQVNDKTNKLETTQPVETPSPIPDFLIESIVKGITKGLQ